jgi:hypothetical protein
MSELRNAGTGRAAVAGIHAEPKTGKLPNGIKRFLTDAAFPIEISLPNGAVVRSRTGEPAVIVALRNNNALRAASSLNEMRIAEAYVNGDIEIAGDLLRAFELRKLLVDHSVLVYL